MRRRSVKLPPKPTPAQLHQLLYGLVYPAVLGSLLYTTIFDQSFTQSPSRDSLALTCTVLIIALFAVDYVYSYSENNTVDYSVAQFLIDFVIVLLAYVAAVSFTGVEAFEKVPGWIYLFLAALVSYFLEEARYYGRKKNRFNLSPPLPKIKRKHANSDFLCAYLYLVFGLLSTLLTSKWSVVPVIAALIVHLIVYIYNVGDA
jgi:hypothetical protein